MKAGKHALRDRAPLAISIAALVVAVLGATSLGQAAVEKVATTIPGFAKTAAYANEAGNAAKLNGHVSSRTGLAGTIPVVGKNGKLPAAIVPLGTPAAAGAAGPQGPAGSKGATGAAGPPGVSGYQV